MPILFFAVLLFLVLLQVTVLPLNLGLALVVAFSIFLKKTSVYIWLVILTLLVSLFANLAVGIVMLAFATTFFTLKFGSEFLPDNNLIKVFLVIAAIPLGEMFLLLMLKTFS